MGKGSQEAQPAGHTHTAAAQAEPLLAAGAQAAGCQPRLPHSRSETRSAPPLRHFQREAHHSRRGHVDERHRAWAQAVCQLAKDDPVGQGLAQVLRQRKVQVGLNGLGGGERAAFEAGIEASLENGPQRLPWGPKASAAGCRPCPAQGPAPSPPSQRHPNVPLWPSTRKPRPGFGDTWPRRGSQLGRSRQTPYLAQLGKELPLVWGLGPCTAPGGAAELRRRGICKRVWQP